MPPTVDLKNQNVLPEMIEFQETIVSQQTSTRDVHPKSSPTKRLSAGLSDRSLLGRLASFKNGVAHNTSQLATNLQGRQMSVGTHLAGIGGSRLTNGSNSTVLPAHVEYDLSISSEPRSEWIEQSGDFMQRVETILDTSLMDLPTVDRRPQRSLGMKALMGLPGLGFMKPKTVRQLMACDPAYRQKSPKKFDIANDVPIDGSLTETRQIDILRPLNESINAYAHAKDGVSLARQAYDKAKKAASSGDGGSRRQIAMKAHETLLREAQDVCIRAAGDLRARVAVCDALDLGVHVLSMDLVDLKVKFADSQIRLLREELNKDSKDVVNILNHFTELKTNLDNKRVATLTALNKASELHDSAAMLVETLEQRLSLFHVKERNADLSNVLPADIHSNSDVVIHDETSASDPINGLQRDLEAAKAVMEDAANEKQKCKEAKEYAVRQSLEFEPYFNEEIDRLARFQHSLETAGRELDATGLKVGIKAQESSEQLKTNRDLERQLATVNARALALVPAGFALDKLQGDNGARLSSGMRRFAEALPDDDVGSERWLPRVAAMDMLCRGLSFASEGDPARACKLLDMLGAHPLDYWIDPPEDQLDSAVDHAPPDLDMTRLMEGMAGIPRGLEVLNLALANADAVRLERGQIEAAQAFWMAHQAKRDASPDVKTWLGNAMRVASKKARNTQNKIVFDGKEIPLKQHAAYNAVRNGFLSNAPGSDYDLSNQNLLNVTETIEDLMDPRDAPLNWLPRSLNPAKQASPFRPEALRLAQKQMEAQGMETTKTRAESTITEVFKELGSQARTLLISSPSAASPSTPQPIGERLLAASIVALADLVGKQARSPSFISRMTTPVSAPNFSHTKRLYDAELGEAEKAEVRRAVLGMLHPERLRPGHRVPLEPNLNRSVTLPFELERLFSQKRVPVIDI